MADIDIIIQTALIQTMQLVDSKPCYDDIYE